MMNKCVFWFDINRNWFLSSKKAYIIKSILTYAKSCQVPNEAFHAQAYVYFKLYVDVLALRIANYPLQNKYL